MSTLSTSKIKYIKSLSVKKFRDASGCFVVEGEKLVSEAEASGWQILEKYRRDDIGPEAMSRISSLDSPPPVLAVVKMRDTDVLPNGEGPLVVLDAIRDPGNMGTIIRTAEWFGARAVVASLDSVELYNPKVIQASMGSAFRIPILYRDLTLWCKEFTSSGGSLLGLMLEGDNIYNADYSAISALALVTGNESRGISPKIAELLSGRITIPSAEGNKAESLNAAVATAVALSVVNSKRRSL